jgi:uncharacterized membrane protein SirB2
VLEYPTLKAVHVTSVSVSFALFFVRGVWMMRESALLRQAWVRVVPHLVDTVLLASAIAMAVMTRQYPFVATLLTAKVLALVVYIGLGMVALKYGRTPGVRVAAWIAALAVFAYIAAVAVTRNAAPWSALLQ